MTEFDARQAGREAFALRMWGRAFEHLSAAQDIGPEDLEHLATAAYLIGKDEESAHAWARAYHAHLERHESERAARAAFWLSFGLMSRGEMARASGWLTRAGRLLEDGRDCPEQGFLLVPSALGALMGGDPGTARELFARVGEIGVRFGDPDLVAMSQVGQGQSLVRLGRSDEGVALLDEVMIAVTAGETSETIAGLVYCAVIEACQECFDVRRAQEWTQALAEWCATQPDLVPYRGQCLVHRSEILQMRGAWPDALEEAVRARERLSDPPSPAVGLAYYQLGELHRLRGEFKRAEESYREANRWGRQPQPGLALLRLAQGQVDAAAGAIRREIDEAHALVERAKLLPACVEILLAAQDLAGARAASDELSKIARDVHAPQLEAIADHCEGAVRLTEGDGRGALDALRTASAAWQKLDAPYEVARARVLIAEACRQLGDADTARLEVDAARRVFEQLDAAPDLDRLGGGLPEEAHGLTPREIEVLRLIATGKTNRAIAQELVISEKTVARHVSNIFTKLDLSSRAAATAFAYERELV